MRSDLVFEAEVKVENRFLLAALAMRAAKKLHVSSTRTEDTINGTLAKLASGNCVHGVLPEIKRPEPIDLFLITPAA